MIYGVGIDLIEIPRFKRVLTKWNDRFIKRVYTRREEAGCRGTETRDEYYAVRFAAKEAFLKSLGSGLRGGISWLDIETVNDHLGKPEINLFGRARDVFENAGIHKIFISLSHTKNYGTAMVVLEN